MYQKTIGDKVIKASVVHNKNYTLDEKTKKESIDGWAWVEEKVQPDAKKSEKKNLKLEVAKTNTSRIDREIEQLQQRIAKLQKEKSV